MHKISIGGFAWRIAFTPAQAVVGFGLLLTAATFAIVRRELTGQASVDDVDDNR